VNNFKITYLLHDKPREYWQKADDGLEAECKFLSWAGYSLSSPVKVVRVEKMVT